MGGGRGESAEYAMEGAAEQGAAPVAPAAPAVAADAAAAEVSPEAAGSDLTAADAERINGLVFGGSDSEPEAVPGVPGGAVEPAAPVSDVDGIESIADLYRTALGMPLEVKGLKRAAEYWNTTGPERMAKPTYMALMRYEYGRKFMAWLSGGGPGAAEFGLVMAAAAVVRETKALIAQDIAEMQAAPDVPAA